MFIPGEGRRGCGSPPQQALANGSYTPSTGCQSITGQTPFTCIRIASGNLDSRIHNEANLVIFELWEETSAPEANPRRHGEHSNAAQKRLGWDLNQEPEMHLKFSVQCLD